MFGKPKGEETSFIVTCFDTCNEVSIRFNEDTSTDVYASDYPHLFALDHDKPKIRNGSCTECENLCISTDGASCRNITTSGDKFYLTVYHKKAYPYWYKITLVNVMDVNIFGKFVNVVWYSIMTENI